MSSTAIWYATRASGLMALILLTVTMVMGITTTTRARARHWPGFAQQEMHRRISILAVVFLGTSRAHERHGHLREHQLGWRS